VHLHSHSRQISVGFIGYPNVGKSSVINTLCGKRATKVAPIAGETKVWQYVTLFRKVFLVDCPGTVAPSRSDTAEDIVLRGVCQVEKLQEPAAYVPAVLARVKREHMVATYGVQEWEDANSFMEQLAVRQGKLLKQGEPDVPTVAKMVLNDFIRGKLPHFNAPPEEEGKDVEVVQADEPAKKKRRLEDGRSASQPDREALHSPVQDVASISVRSEYADPLAPQQADEDAGLSEEEHEEEDGQVDEDDERQGERSDEEVVDWDDVFAAAKL